MNLPESKYYYLSSHKQLRYERTLLKMRTKAKSEKFRVQWETLKEFVTPSNLMELLNEKLQPVRNIMDIASYAFSSITSLLGKRRRRKSCF